MAKGEYTELWQDVLDDLREVLQEDAGDPTTATLLKFDPSTREHQPLKTVNAKVDRKAVGQAGLSVSLSLRVAEEELTADDVGNIAAITYNQRRYGLAGIVMEPLGVNRFWRLPLAEAVDMRGENG